MKRYYSPWPNSPSSTGEPRGTHFFYDRSRHHRLNKEQKTNNNMKTTFEIGKAYQHNAGMQMFICGIADTVYHGFCFVAETGWDREKLKERMAAAERDQEKIQEGGFNRKELVPISMKEYAVENWFEITKEQFVSNNTEKD